MPFTIPDFGEGDDNIQSVLFQEHLEILAAGMAGTDCVIFGCAPTAQGSPNMTVAISKGGVLSNGTLFAVAAANATITTAHATLPRLDLIVITNAGAIAVRAGTAAATPKPPARSANDVVIAQVYVPAADTTIATSQITDMRVMRSQGPLLLKKVTSPVTFATTNAIQTYLSITLPDGLMTAGRCLRVICGGSYLSNSGSPTWTLTISLGGTTHYADATAATTADADRGAWMVEFYLMAQGSSDQAYVGCVTFQTPGAKTAPATGQAGDMAVTTHVSAPFAAAGAVNCDTANRDLLVRWTMSVSNANVSTSLEHATVELL